MKPFPCLQCRRPLIATDDVVCPDCRGYQSSPLRRGTLDWFDGLVVAIVLILLALVEVL